MPSQPTANAAVFTLVLGSLGSPRFDDATLAAMARCYDDNGFVVLRGLFTDDLMDRMEAECVAAQSSVIAGELDDRHGSTVFLDDAAKAEKFANYVEFVNELSPEVVAGATHPGLVQALRRVLGPDIWMRDASQFGIVY